MLAINEITALAATDAFPVLADPGGTPNPGMARMSAVTAFLATATIAPLAPLTASAPMTLAQTWNNAGVTFTGLKVNVTDTASAAASLLMSLQVGGASRLSVSKNGQITVPNDVRIGTAANANIICQSNNSLLLNYLDSSGGLLVSGTGIRVLVSGGAVEWGTSSNPSVSSDLRLYRDAAGRLALRHAANAQAFLVSGYYASATSLTQGQVKCVTTTLTGVSGASVTASSLRPKGAFVVGVATTVTVALGVTNGTTGYTIGDGSDADRYGDITGTAIGTDSDNTDAVADPTGYQAAAGDVVITAKGGDFDGTGTIIVSVFYLTTEAA